MFRMRQVIKITTIISVDKPVLSGPLIRKIKYVMSRQVRAFPLLYSKQPTAMLLPLTGSFVTLLFYNAGVHQT